MYIKNLTLPNKSHIFIIKSIMKNENKIIGVAIDKELLKKVDAGNYNRSKLIDSLLTKYYKQQIKIKNNS